MPFGLMNAPTSFQRFINKILAVKLDIFVIVYLDNIFIYTGDDGDGHVAVVRWVLEQLRKFSLFANLKKCQFHQDEVWFLSYVISSKGIRMEDERIVTVKQWPEPQSVRDIQVFFRFANFYRQFIQGFTRIAAPLTSMLKTSSTKSAKLRKGVVGVSGDSKTKRDGGKLDGSGTDDVEVDDNKVENDEVGKKSRNSSKSKNLSKSKKTELGFLTSGARRAFTKLRQAFIKALILHHFDSECHIWLETDLSGYAIGGVFSQLNSDNSGRWHPVAFFSRKIIPAETRYETHNCEFLAIVEAFKNWKHYLERSQYEVLVLTDYNNLHRFMETKGLSSKQVYWAQELSHYHFQINYRQGKTNRAADALSRYPQQSTEEEETLRAKNVKILHHLQSSLARISDFSTSQLSSSQLLPLHQIIIYRTTILPRLNKFWDILRGELNEETPYKASIGAMRLTL